MADTQPSVSVIILNYNGRPWLPGCLRALAAQDLPGLEVILVDNHSSDGSAALVRDQFPDVRLVESGRNLGFAAGNNAGAAVARGRYLAFLNNDTEVDPGWASALAAALDAHPQAGLATSLVLYLHDPTIVDSAGDGYTRWGGAFKRRHGQPEDGSREIREVFGACGAAFMIRREAFDQLGGFDEDLFLVYEDVDLSYRAQLLGHRCLFVPAARVRHAGSATMGTVSATSVFYGQRNLEWVYLKNTPRSILWRTLPGHVVYSLSGGVYLTASGHLGTWLKAKWAALAGLRSVMRKRRHVQLTRVPDTSRVWSLMEKSWIVLKWREKRFDLGKARAR